MHDDFTIKRSRDAGDGVAGVIPFPVRGARGGGVEEARGGYRTAGTWKPGDGIASDRSGPSGDLATMERVGSFVHRRVRELLVDLDALVFVSWHPGAIWGTAQRGIDDAFSERIAGSWWHPGSTEHGEVLAQCIAASLRTEWEAVPQPDAEGRLRVPAWRQADGFIVWEPDPRAEPITVVLEPGSRLAQHAMGSGRLVCRDGEMRGLRVMEAVEAGWARVECSESHVPAG